MTITELGPKEADFSYSPEYIESLRNKSKRNGIIGQPRALSALEMGMSVPTKGYNIYLSGDDGTGRHSAVRQVAAKINNTGKLFDVAYAYNFLKSESPLLLLIPSPRGSHFRDRMEEVASLLEQQEGKEKATKKLEETIEEFKDLPLVLAFLRHAKNDILKPEKVPEKYRINLAVDNSLRTERPLIFEFHPTHSNLFGQITRKSQFAHLQLSAGSLLDAVGGFFVVDIEQVLSQTSLWESLKLFADSSSFLIRNENPAEPGFVKPVSVDLPVKLILIGSDALYDKLCDNDEQFLRLFKVSSEFDFSMPANETNICGTIAYILDTIKDNSLKEITNDGLCSLLSYSSWYAEMRNELTTRLSFIGDLLFEADYWARKNGKEMLDANAINGAREERNFANGITESRINQEIQSGEMIISLEGSKIGVVNGLAIMDRGLTSFGTPTVISATVAPGSEGIVNIEHEAGLSGEIHDKGLLILEGYLRKRYARNFPLSIYAGICFEQSYAEVDGDSASSSELFALLSAIGEVPVRQDIAVTGSVNQLGDIQPVGGINEKIEGFFSICEKTGLSGHQGVIIPKQNINSLILPQKIVTEIENHKFHIYPIQTIDEGMEILTLRPSGERTQKGTFPPDSVNRLIEERLKKLFDLAKPSN